MRRLVFVLLASLILFVPILMAPLPARANTGVIETVNGTKYWMWVTVYNLGKTIQHDYGAVDAGANRTWGRCCYSAGSYYYVRAEIKTNNGHGSKIGDTTIEVVPVLARKKFGNECEVYGYARVVLLNSGGHHFYWKREDQTPSECLFKGKPHPPSMAQHAHSVPVLTTLLSVIWWLFP